MQKFYDFVEDAKKTAVFPTDAADYYPALKLCGECAEYYEKIEQNDIEGAMIELGDLLWYVAMIYDIECNHLEMPLTIQKAELHIACGNIAEWIGKRVRDRGGDKEKLRDMLAQVLHRVSREARIWGYSLDQVMFLNRKKLASRQTRGTLQGEGDYR